MLTLKHLEYLELKNLANRNRISVNFSKQYTNEYHLIMQEKNASELICQLLRKHYTGDVTNADIFNKIDELLHKINGVKIEIEDEDLDNAIDSW